MSYERGTVVKAHFEIVYPNGDTKSLDLEGDEISTVSFIAFDESAIREEDRDRFNVSEDAFDDNPSMIVYSRGDGTDADPLGIPFCTHNGCKK